jgi:hypothetical protein
MAERDEMSFSKAFADARREMGAGKTFTWRGSSYTTDYAEEAPSRGGRTGPATDRAPTESPRPSSRRSIGERIPRRQPPAEPTPRVQRDAQDASPTTRAPRRVERDSQDASPTRSASTAPPASVQRLIDEAPDSTSRAAARRAARDGMERSMPLQSLIRAVTESIRSRRESATADRASSRSEAAATAAAARRQAAEEARAARTGMAKGGMAKKKGYAKGGSVKTGSTDRRKSGMFYDSKSPRGYK